MAFQLHVVMPERACSEAFEVIRRINPEARTDVRQWASMGYGVVTLLVVTRHQDL